MTGTSGPGVDEPAAIAPPARLTGRVELAERGRTRHVTGAHIRERSLCGNLPETRPSKAADFLD